MKVFKNVLMVLLVLSLLLISYNLLANQLKEVVEIQYYSNSNYVFVPEQLKWN